MPRDMGTRSRQGSQGGAPAIAAVGAATDTGRVRDHNEDGYLVSPPLFAVADGVGGHAAGEVASELALRSLAGAVPSISRGGQQALRDALVAANSAVFARATREASSRGMGTTCAALVLEGVRAHLGHVGDSRIYRLRAGALEQLTADHTVAGEMVTQGLMSHDDALSDGTRSLLTRALGAAPSVDVDAMTVEIAAGDRFLLCTDGLMGMIADDAIHGILVGARDPQAAAGQLVQAANDAGGEDNITAVGVDPRDPAELAAARAQRASRPRSRLRALIGIAIAAAILVAAIALGWSQVNRGAPSPSTVQSVQP